MRHKIEAIQKVVADLDLARVAHAKAMSDLEGVRSLCGQQGYSVFVNGIRIDVAENGGRDAGWAAKMIRGREMIHLGALKALQSIIDQRAHALKLLETQLKELIADLSP